MTQFITEAVQGAFLCVNIRKNTAISDFKTENLLNKTYNASRYYFPLIHCRTAYKSCF